jgi:hypothetical protein
MNTDRGAFVQSPSTPNRNGIIVMGCGCGRTVLWLDDFSFEDIRFSELVEGQKPTTNSAMNEIAANLRGINVELLRSYTLVGTAQRIENCLRLLHQ